MSPDIKRMPAASRKETEDRYRCDSVSPGRRTQEATTPDIRPSAVAVRADDSRRSGEQRAGEPCQLR